MLAIAWLSILSFLASGHQGQVTFGGLPVPGATVTATQGDKKFTAVTDTDGLYSLPDLTDGTWTIEVQMSGFGTVKQDVVVSPNAPAAKWELNLLPLDEIKATTATATPPVAGPGTSAPVPPQTPAKTEAASQAPPQHANAAPGDLTQSPSDGFLINGSVNNGAASPFAQFAAFGNNRSGTKGLYNGGIGVILDNSALDAQPFSLTGQNTPKPAYNRVTGVVTLGGPLKIPHLLRNGPNFFVGYQWMRSRNDTTQSGLMPDALERNGNFSQTLSQLGQPLQIIDPTTGLPFQGNAIPQNRISPQARALLNLYPLPNFGGNNFGGNSRYNYQVPIVTATHQDALQSRLNKALNNKNVLYGGLAFQSTRTDTPNLFDFLDTTDVLGINTNLNWVHRFNQRTFMNLGYQFSRYDVRSTPYFENRENVSAQAGISGNNQDPLNWGPPTIEFSSGIAGLTDAFPSYNRNQTGGFIRFPLVESQPSQRYLRK